MEFSPHNQQIHLLGLNDQQREAVLCKDSIVFVNAGPGTGKTHMLTSKLVDVIVSSPTPQKIVALSYTNTAARQLGERFRKKVKECGITATYSFFNGTIHSFCFRMMKQFGETAFDYVILDDEELYEMAQELEQEYAGNYSKQEILSILRSKNNDMANTLSSEIFAIKEAYKVLSIQDILLKFIQMLDEDPAFGQWMANQVSVIAIDEAQDLSLLNYTILDRLLAVNPELRIFIVGDPRQNIFEFNGGSYKNLEEFLSLYPMHAEKDLSITYRCGQAIANFVNGFRFDDCSNLDLQSATTERGTVELTKVPNEAAEAECVLDAISNLGDISSCAVLCNNLRSMDRLISLMQERRMPYKVYGGQKSLKRHIRFLNHILRILASDNAYSIRKIAEYAGIDLLEGGKRKRSKFYASDLGRILTEIRMENESLIFPEVLSQVISRIMRDPSDDEVISGDYDELLSMAGMFTTITDYLLAFSTDKERFSQFYQKDFDECPFPVHEEYLTLSTIHSAKGLEWDHVFIMGLCEGNFPNPFFAKGLSPEKQQEFFNAEWKKMYVAATRARVTLHLSFPASIFRQGYRFNKEPSRFILSLLPEATHLAG